MSCLSPSPPGCATSQNCPDIFGCLANACPDFQIKRNDTRPSFKVSVSDENGPIDLTGLVLEANMWAKAKLKSNIDADTTTIQFADNIGFYQILPNDVIVVDQVRLPEHMKVVSFDETNKTLVVERGYNGTTALTYKRGTCLKIFRFMNAAAVTEMVYEDVEEFDGTTICNVLAESFFVYEWTANDTCVPGCFWMEFKLLKMTDGPLVIPSTNPMCTSGIGVEWVRRFPQCGEFLIQICQSPTQEI